MSADILATSSRECREFTVQVLRVVGFRGRDAGVLATVDGYFVKWKPRDGWTCDCDEHEFPECPHIDPVEALLDPRVTQDPTC